MELHEIHLYRMTHIKNIPHILEHGITHRHSPNANPNYLPIGDQSLIKSRENKVVRITNGDWDIIDVPTIKLGDYIPFYFGIRMPMLYVIQNGGNFVPEATPPTDIIYIACNLKNVLDQKIDGYFSNGHATDAFTTFYDLSQIHHISELLDWEAIKSDYWGGAENLNIKRKKQAEFLVASDLPIETIRGYVCIDERTSQKLLSMDIDKDNIKIHPKAYY